MSYRPGIIAMYSMLRHLLCWLEFYQKGGSLSIADECLAHTWGLTKALDWAYMLRHNENQEGRKTGDAMIASMVCYLSHKKVRQVLRLKTRRGMVG